MPYLVDGNNVMAQNVGWHRDKTRARKQLIRDLVKFVAVHRTKVKVVFDGAPDEEFPEGRRYKGVEIAYAKMGSDADSRILEFVQKASYVRDLVVVTSDKQLGSRVAHLGARVMPSGVFAGLVKEAYKVSPEKPGQTEATDLDEWLRLFGHSNKE